jgi:hypothetical protein
MARERKGTLVWLFLGCAIVGANGCQKQACAPGDQKSCPCAGQGFGIQVCRADGSGYSECGGCAAP